MNSARASRFGRASPAEGQTVLADWELVEPRCWVRKLRTWDERDGECQEP